MKINEERIRLWGKVTNIHDRQRTSNIQIIGIPESREQKGKGTSQIIKTKIQENVHEIKKKKKDLKLHVERAHCEAENVNPKWSVLYVCKDVFFTNYWILKEKKLFGHVGKNGK